MFYNLTILDIFNQEMEGSNKGRRSHEMQYMNFISDSGP